MNPGYTIRIFVPDGDPEGVRVVDRMNWTGRCHVVPRAKWMQARARWNFRRAGLYVLIGFEEDDLPTIYVGKSDDLHTRIDQHDKDAGKSFWDRCIVFTSSASDLNATHAAWLEWQLVKMAAAAGRARLANGNAPAEPNLSEAERADMEAFLEEVLRILPLVDVRAFERGKPVIPRKAAAARTAESGKAAPPDTIVVPPRKKASSASSWARIAGMRSASRRRSRRICASSPPIARSPFRRSRIWPKSSGSSPMAPRASIASCSTARPPRWRRRSRSATRPPARCRGRAIPAAPGCGPRARSAT